MAKAAIYARQSVDKKDSISIEGQINLCKKECDSEVEIYEDKGFSGKNIKRPAFEKMMQDVRLGKIDKVICYRLDRISRSIADFGNIWDTLSQNNVEFVSVNEKFDTSTPVGRAMLYIIMVFAQLERETIAERVKDNYYQRVKQGAWGGGPAPYGFRIAEKSKSKMCTLETTEEINTVKQIFKLYSAPGASLGKIAKHLNENNISCSRRKNWDNVAVLRVIRQPAYVKADINIYNYYKNKGVIICNDAEEFNGMCSAYLVGKRTVNERKYTNIKDHVFVLSKHKGVIDSDIFLACQYNADSNRQIKNTGKGKYTWLSGLLKCGNCGYSIKVLNDKRNDKQYLVCSGNSNLKMCNERHSEKLTEIEPLVENQIIRYILNLKKNIVKIQNDMADKTNILRTELQQTEEKISKLVEKIPDANNITMRYINVEISKLEEQRQALTQNILNNSIVNDFEDLIEIDFKSSGFETKKAISKRLIARVVCTNELIKIDWRA